MTCHDHKEGQNCNDHASQHNMTCLSLAALSFAVFLFFAFQMQQIMMERTNLQQVLAKQEPQISEITKLQEALDKLAIGTAQLADSGNKNAREIVEAYKKQGITFGPQKDNSAQTTSSAAPAVGQPAAKAQ